MNDKLWSEFIGDKIEETIWHVLDQACAEARRTERSTLKVETKSAILKSAAESGIPIELLPSAFRTTLNNLPA